MSGLGFSGDTVAFSGLCVFSVFSEACSDSDIFADFTVFEGIAVFSGTGVDSDICNSSDSPFSASNCSDRARSPRYFPFSPAIFL